MNKLGDMLKFMKLTILNPTYKFQTLKNIKDRKQVNKT
jgi:hypothetical protein